MTTDHSPLTTHHSRAAFTLVEMLIAMVLTLILVTAIAQFYAIVGDSVKDGRAMIEIGGKLRSAVERLKADLDQITVTLVPWTDDGSSTGYFEYFEGPGYDCNVNGNFVTNSSGGIVDPKFDNDIAEDSDGNGVNDLVQLGITNLLGDADDFLACTVRSGGQPFSGRYTVPLGSTATITYSQLAEVVWWVGFDDISQDGAWQFDEPRHLYRRQLLIRPDITNIDLNPSNGQPMTYPSYSAAEQRLKNIWQENDISLSVRYGFNAGAVYYFVAPNSLSDLSKREYRFAHQPLSVSASSTNPAFLIDATFPHKQQLLPSYSMKTQGVTPQTSYVLQKTNGTAAENPGEDVVISNIIGFDIQIFDPYARVWPDDPAQPNSSSTQLFPSDPGYAKAAQLANQRYNNSNPPDPPPLVSLGAFVDLGYYRYQVVGGTFIDDSITATTVRYNPPLFRAPYYAQLPDVPPAIANTGNATLIGNYRNQVGATYDTWSQDYERDGIFQLGQFGVNGSTWRDAQTNGGDDDGVNGVDDAGERETVPPFSQPLRGLQVKIRVYEPSTRQVRQATVATDFVTE